ncbi:MAG: hypothetical protein CO133_00555, partial [Candidatus Komeilibacteria bacterium CG_4_9_14_3_um_filter_37_5]
LFPLMAGSMGFVSASEDEGMPITILEALSLGVPLVVSDIEGHRELFDQCHSLTFNVGDIKKLKLKMDQLIQQKAKWQKITKKNQLIINEQYNWEDIAKSLNTLYKQEIMAPQSLAQTLF